MPLRRFLPLASVLVLIACGEGPDENAHAESGAAPSAAADVSGQTGRDAREAHHDEDEDEDEDDEHRSAEDILASLGADYVDADLQNGARQFRRCQSCHTLNAGGRHTVGPNLYGVIGREAAAAEGFNYSRQLAEAGIVWDAESLDAWIENPRAMVPGNRMSFVGLRDADDRRDVIAHIAVETTGGDED